MNNPNHQKPFSLPLPLLCSLMFSILLLGPALVARGGLPTTSTSTLKPADPATYLSELTAIFKTQWPKNRAVNIVCHGHSVPAGYFKTPLVDTFNAYPHLLHRGLKDRYPFAVINVIVTAI